jgi:subtilisin family serine protease
VTRAALSRFGGRTFGWRFSIRDSTWGIQTLPGDPSFPDHSSQAKRSKIGTDTAPTALAPRVVRNDRGGCRAAVLPLTRGSLSEKVLSNQGSGADAGILAGIQWAITNKCPVVSMSLGAPVFPGEGFSQIFEMVAQRALAAGTLIIAAAGNDSARPGTIRPVGHPANCPSIMAVGALDVQMRVASFSNGGLNQQGGQVDIAGPGVAVRSSWPRPVLHNTISGTYGDTACGGHRRFAR